MLKKQTVWLLTMLSLMIVLSVYYLLADKEDFAYVQTEKEVTEETIQNENDDGIEVDDISEVKSNELFQMIRMEIEDKRNMKKDRLKEVVASKSATTAEINEALNEIDKIESITTKEKILQESILSSNEKFEDVLIRAEDDIVHVQIITDQLEKKEANQVMRAVKDELGEVAVDVNFESFKE